MQKVNESNSIFNIDNLAQEIQKLRNKTEEILENQTKITYQNRRISPAEIYETPKENININNNSEDRLNEEVKVSYSSANYNQERSEMNINENDQLL